MFESGIILPLKSIWMNWRKEKHTRVNWNKERILLYAACSSSRINNKCQSSIEEQIVW